MRIVLVALALCAAVPLRAQHPRVPKADSQARALSCPDCRPAKRPLFGFGELMIVQLIPSTVNNVLRDAEWADVSPKTWYNNLQNPWQWDDNKFLNNQFSHPYHGNLYFNSARANGYNFWASAPWAFGGSLMWELFGEVWAPSPNDFLNTSLGGIALGEMLWRVSSLVLDNTDRGASRTWREIGAGLLNPVRGFARLVHGEAGRTSATPPEWRPSFVHAALDAGWRRIGGSSSLSGPLAVDQAFILFRLNYGRLMDDVVKQPFSHFTVLAELTDKASQGQRGRLSRLTATGTLAGVELSRSEQARHELGAFMRYEYYSNPAFEFGGQSFAGGWLARWKESSGFVLETSLLGTVYPIGATRSDVFTTEEGRDYDYGLGGGGAFTARFLWWPRAVFDLGYTGVYIHTLDGAKSDHFQGGGSANFRVNFTNRLGVGASYLNYYRHSSYETFPTVTQTSPTLSVYLGYAIPGLER